MDKEWLSAHFYSAACGQITWRHLPWRTPTFASQALSDLIGIDQTVQLDCDSDEFDLPLLRQKSNCSSWKRRQLASVLSECAVSSFQEWLHALLLDRSILGAFLGSVGLLFCYWLSILASINGCFGSRVGR